MYHPLTLGGSGLYNWCSVHMLCAWWNYCGPTTYCCFHSCVHTPEKQELTQGLCCYLMTNILMLLDVTGSCDVKFCYIWRWLFSVCVCISCCVSGLFCALLKLSVILDDVLGNVKCIKYIEAPTSNVSHLNGRYMYCWSTSLSEKKTRADEDNVHCQQRTEPGTWVEERPCQIPSWRSASPSLKGEQPMENIIGTLTAMPAGHTYLLIHCMYISSIEPDTTCEGRQYQILSWRYLWENSLSRRTWKGERPLESSIGVWQLPLGGHIYPLIHCMYISSMVK